MTAYATYADLEAALDAQIIAQLCSDLGSPMLGSNPVTTHALERATGIVQAYTRVGNIYTDLDLTTLSAAHDPLLMTLVVDLAVEALFQRRAMKITPAVEQRLKQAYSMLEALRDGKMIFGAVAKAANAGLPEVQATPLQTLAYYNGVSNSAFFRPRLPNTMPGN
jgi:phage gp36-like protein